MQQRRSFENARPQSIVESSQWKGLDKWMYHSREALVREKHAGEDPHRHHHQIDETADAFDLLGAAGGKKADSAEGERSDSRDQRDRGDRAKNPHMEEQDAEG